MLVIVLDRWGDGFVDLGVDLFGMEGFWHDGEAADEEADDNFSFCPESKGDEIVARISRVADFPIEVRSEGGNL